MYKEGLKISIITVSYNSVKTIEQTIRSVLNQTYGNIEYIIIDGASIDGTQRIIEKYLDEIDYYVSERDKGIYYAMNKGIAKATGDIIGIINSDDWYADDAVKSIAECFEKNDVELVYGRIMCITDDGRRIRHPYFPIESIWYQMALPHPSVFVRKKVYNLFGVFNMDYHVASDYELMLRFYSNKVKFHYLNKIVAYFRYGGISMQQNKICDEERYKISMTYVNQCPYADKALLIIQEPYKWTYFRNAFEKDGKIVGNFLNEDVIVDNRNIVIFGIGTWGERCYNVLSQAGIQEIYFMDNSPAKWNTQFHGLYVLNPNELKSMAAHVLIAVKEYGEDIKKQLISMGNSKLHLVTIDELKEMYWTKYSF